MTVELVGENVRKQCDWAPQAVVSSGLSVCFVGVTQLSAHLCPAPPPRRRQLTSSVQSSRNSVARSSHATQFCRPRRTLRAVSMTSVPPVAARSSSAMTWGPTPQPVLRQALLWETGVLALSVVSVLLISFGAQIQGMGQQWWRFLHVSPTSSGGPALGGRDSLWQGYRGIPVLRSFCRGVGVFGKGATSPSRSKSPL